MKKKDKKSMEYNRSATYSNKKEPHSSSPNMKVETVTSDTSDSSETHSPESNISHSDPNSPEKKSKENFQNLSWAPLPQGKSECLDPLAPYKVHNCGPVNMNNFLSNVQFKPECCGNPAGSSYSNSVGCACLCPEQITFLNSRGGNRTFPTEF